VSGHAEPELVLVPRSVLKAAWHHLNGAHASADTTLQQTRDLLHRHLGYPGGVTIRTDTDRLLEAIERLDLGNLEQKVARAVGRANATTEHRLYEAIRAFEYRLTLHVTQAAAAAVRGIRDDAEAAAEESGVNSEAIEALESRTATLEAVVSSVAATAIGPARLEALEERAALLDARVAELAGSVGRRFLSNADRLTALEERLPIFEQRLQELYRRLAALVDSTTPPEPA
jgi:hypothetical protein